MPGNSYSKEEICLCFGRMDLISVQLWMLKSLFEFDGKVLGEAIFKTFKRRNRTIPVNPPVIFTPEFHESKLKQKQWTAFLRKSRLDVGDKSLSDIIAEIAEFLMPLLKKCRSSDI